MSQPLGRVRFALVDHSLTSPLGHNLTYARRVLTAAAAQGYEVVAGVGVEGEGQDVCARSLPLFAHDVWMNNPAEGRLWHAAAILARARGEVAQTPTSSIAEPRAGAAPHPPAPAAGRRRRMSRVTDGLRSDAAAVLAIRGGVRRFAADLEMFLKTAGLEAGDIVYLPTALAAELRGLDRLLLRSVPARGLRWRVMLRYAPQARSVRAAIGRAAARLHRRAGVDVRLFSDTERLCAFYEGLCATPFHLLPVPVDALQPAAAIPRTPLTVGYVGDARDEKGFDLLPGVIAAVRAQAGGADLRFLVQINLNTPDGEPRARAALAALQALDDPQLELVEGPLSPDAYGDLLRRADIVLLPYRSTAYAERSSGILMEAISAGLPTVVTRGGWLESALVTASHMSPAGVVSEPDAQALAGGVLRIAADWERYAEGARLLRDALRFRYDPAELVREVAR